MADTVSTVTIFQSKKRLAVKCLSRSDGTGESNVVKVDISTLTGPNGAVPSGFAIERIEYDVSGMEVAISIDLTTDVVVARLQGQGILDYAPVGGIMTKGDGSATGDILFSTNGHSAGDTYDITLFLRKKD